MGSGPPTTWTALVLFQTGPVSTLAKIGPSEGMKCPNVVTVNDDGTYVEHGPSLIFPQVLVDSLVRFDPGAWVSGRLDQTNRWYSLEPVDDDKLELLEEGARRRRSRPTRSRHPPPSVR